MSFSDSWSRWRSRTGSFLRKRGLIPQFLVVLRDPEKRFDKRYRVDTAGVLKPVELQSDPRYKHSNWYGPTDTARFREMLRSIRVDYSKFVFIDFGCGKGKVLLLASALPFKQIIGVEVWSEMISMAEQNLRTYTGARNSNNIGLHHVDAGEFAIPDGPGIYYFFDPFREEVMSRVLENIRRSLSAAPREVYVIYCEPERPDILENCGFLTRIRQTKHYSIYKARRDATGTRQEIAQAEGNVL